MKMVPRPSGMPTTPNMMSSDTPMMISGIMSGRNDEISTYFLSRKLYQYMPMAASVPSSADTLADVSAMMALLPSARHRSREPKKSSLYHRRENPLQVMVLDALNEKSTRTNSGA